MSNKVGELYDIIIENVIKETRTEFEESGDDPAVLDILKNTWKKRLMGMNVTKDPLWTNAQQQGSQPAAHPDLSHTLRATGPGSLGAGVGVPGQDGLHVAGDTLGLYGIPQVKDLEGDATARGIPGDGLGRSQPSTEKLPQHPSYIKPEPFDLLSGRGGSGSGAGTPQPAAYNPLDSSKVGPSMPSNQRNIQLSPELNNQIHNAMNGTHPRLPQQDGPQDEELNSDLDDSEDELNSNDEDEDNDQTQIMLCLYEKVHKVKTRWKYTLKDGVANVNGLDYVFTRATGESEW